MKKYLLIALFICGNLVAFSQSSSEQIAQEKATLPKPYHPEEDGAGSYRRTHTPSKKG